MKSPQVLDDLTTVTSGAWPRHLLRHLLLDHEAGIGSRVLHVGSDGGELVRFLTHLGLQAVQLDDNPVQLSVSRDDVSPVAEVRHASPVEGVPFDEQTFDLVIVDRLHAWGRTLNAPEALLAAAQLLSCVRPGGFLVVPRRSGSEEFHTCGGHTAACHADLLARFPREVSTVCLPDGLARSETWSWVLGRRPRPGHSVVSVKTPAEPIPRNTWLQTAVVASSQTGGSACCEWSRLREGEADLRRVA